MNGQVRAYYAARTPEIRKHLKRIHDAITSAAPGAEEVFSYGIPGFRLDGKVLMWYAAWKSHTSIYPITGAVRAKHADAISAYRNSKGTIQFPLTKLPPVTLIKRMVKTRAAEIRGR
ncbi:MAG TPA: DUF1801 domain-containing protein [Gemmatimonadales bacterium]|nr:DUF1801 domain-containing protein [Gemmatimonadales bacterium]